MSVVKRSEYVLPPYTTKKAVIHFNIISEDCVEATFEYDVERTSVWSADSGMKLNGMNFTSSSKIQICTVTGEHLSEVETDFSSAYPSDGFTIPSSSLPSTHPSFKLKGKVVLDPVANKSGEGLYKTGELLLTQCEAESFRRICPFQDRPDVMSMYTIRLEADKDKYPTLLSNGSCVEKGDLEGNRHYVVFEDPWPKPSYLFAIVAGKLENVEAKFMRKDNVESTLRIWAEPQHHAKLDWAMKSLLQSFKWDEEKFGRIYDCPEFNVVAAEEFNMGAMENKSLNIFNAALLLYSKETSTDATAITILRVVGHEYFHNWSGNRVTCRDWFQLTLKEGLTVFRDALFSEDTTSAGVRRINDIKIMTNHQFAEDSGPMSHPIRPDEYTAIDNFYSVTVYYKGSEIQRMLTSLVGFDQFRKGCDAYFAKYDGQAVCCEDFLECIKGAADQQGKKNLEGFEKWYSQKGTPTIEVNDMNYDADKKTFSFTLDTNSPDGTVIVYPFKYALLSKADGSVVHEEMLPVNAASVTHVIPDVACDVVPSFMRNFCVPAKLKYTETRENALFRVAYDKDSYTSYEAVQSLLEELVLAAYEAFKSGASPAHVDPKILEAFTVLVNREHEDKAHFAMCFSLPDQAGLIQKIEKGSRDPQLLNKAVKYIGDQVYGAIYPCIVALFDLLKKEAAGFATYELNVNQIGVRALMNSCLVWMSKVQGKENEVCAQVLLQLQSFADSFDVGSKSICVLSGLKNLSPANEQQRTAALAEYRAKCTGDVLTEDAYLGCIVRHTPSVESFREIREKDELFKDCKNPNRLRAVFGTFAGATTGCLFHNEDGSGYKVLTEAVLYVDPFNAITASSLAKKLIDFKNYEPKRSALMKEQIEFLLTKELSANTKEVLQSALK